MKKYFAELVGTFFLVFFGVGVAVITGEYQAWLALLALHSRSAWV